jgi:peptidyl-prolyl cis-trans isomerase B (cyclophilin B)
VKRAVVLLGLLLAAGCGGDDSGPGPQVTSCEVEIQDPARAPELQPLDRDERPRIEFVTSHGNFTVEIDPTQAPCNGDSMVDLARKGFFEGTRFHRIVPGFVIQGGDPRGDGTGGPGYTVVEKPPGGLQYVKGVVAMAKGGNEPAGASGSQWFVVTAEDAQLPPDYALLGKVTEGQDVVDKIGAVPTTPDEQPTDPVVIRSVKVSGP